MYENLLIYYFSGTGNALSVANWVKENAENENIKVQSHSIEKIKNVEIPDL
jgi:flavodoxin